MLEPLLPSDSVDLKVDTAYECARHFFDPAFRFARRGAPFFFVALCFVTFFVTFFVALLFGFEAAFRFAPAAFFFVGAA